MKPNEELNAFLRDRGIFLVEWRDYGVGTVYGVSTRVHDDQRVIGVGKLGTIHFTDQMRVDGVNEVKFLIDEMTKRMSNWEYNDDKR